MKRAIGSNDTWLGVLGLLGMAAVSLTVTAAETPATTGKANDQNKTDEKIDAATKSDEPDPGEFNNWITFGLGRNFVNGDEPQFQYRHQMPADTFGGIEDFHFERPVGKKGLFAIDGRAIFDNNDHLVKLSLMDPDKGYVRVGYREFRTWYDGSGGFSQNSNAWLSIYNEDLHVDRGQAWIEAGLTLPEWPVFAVRYAYEFRDGKKDSTSWGDYNLNSAVPGGATVLRGIIPTFWDIDEKRHIISADVSHGFGKTALSGGVRYEISDNDNSRNVRRRAGEPTADRYVTQHDEVRSDLFSAHGNSETRLSDRLMFTLGYSYTTLDTDISGSRIYGTSYNAAYDPLFPTRQARDEGFLDLMGGSQLQQHVANLNLMYQPWTSLAIIPSVRIESQNQEGVADFTETSFGTGAGIPATTDDIVNRKSREFLDVTEALEARYTGVKRWAFYARAELLEGTGDLTEREREAPSGPTELFRDTESQRLTQKYTVGANWYPHRKISLGGQYYYRIRQTDFDHVADNTIFAPPVTNDFYPAFIKQLDLVTHDANMRVTWRPVGGVTSVTRYDLQLSTYDMEGDQSFDGANLDKIQSADVTTHMLSQSLSWTPLARLFLQGTVSYVLDETETPADEVTTGPAANTVQKMRNDYWIVSSLIGFVLNEKTDLHATYSYYRADNYRNNSAFGQPYGSGATEHVGTVSLIHRFSRSLLGRITYGIFTNDDELYGGHNDYTTHLVYSSLQYQF